MLKSVKERIKRIFADKGYDSKAIYKTFGENASSKSRCDGSAYVKTI